MSEPSRLQAWVQIPPRRPTSTISGSETCDGRVDGRDRVQHLVEGAIRGLLRHDDGRAFFLMLLRPSLRTHGRIWLTADCWSRGTINRVGVARGPATPWRIAATSAHARRTPIIGSRTPSESTASNGTRLSTERRPGVLFRRRSPPPDTRAVSHPDCMTPAAFAEAFYSSSPTTRRTTS
jgi:hypothetical protein